MRQELSPAIEDYLRFRRSQDYSKSTLRSDQGVLKKFLSVNGNVWCHTLTHRHIERHFEEVSRTRQGASLKLDHGVLTRFLKWCRHTGRMPVDADPMYGRRAPRVTKKERNRIAVTEFPRLLETAEERDPRDRALCALLLYTLGRDSDVTPLRIRDLDLAGGWITMRVQKTRQEDRVPISKELDHEMREWLTHYTAITGPLQPHYFLVPARAVFPIRDGSGRIVKHESSYRPEKQIRGASRIVTPVLERIGFPVTDENGDMAGEGAHTIRRSGARALYDQLVATGYDHSLRVVQSLLHHASVQQTEVYIGVTADRRTRDDLLRGHRMYPNMDAANVVQLVR